MTAVLVTGATGYLAAELILQLLKLGYAVRATVRAEASLQRCAHLQALADHLPGTLELLVVNLVTGSFDAAVAGCRFVHHLAAPTQPIAPNPQETQVDPALRGTRNVLEAVARAGCVQRVVMTSSVGAIQSVASGLPPRNGSIFTEEDWCTGATIEDDPYSTSKVEAEKLAWQLSEQLCVDLVTINPSIIFGSVYMPKAHDKAFTFSVAVMQSFLEGKADLPTDGIVDIADVARAHILAAELPAAKGRYIVSHESRVPPQEVAQIMNAALPECHYDALQTLPATRFRSNAKATKEFGLRLTPPCVSLPAMARCMFNLGYAKPKLKAVDAA